MKRVINTAQGQSSKGFTLVELMVAMVIGLLMMGGVMQVFISNKQTHRQQEAMARVQENGRIAIQIITQDVRMANFWGCVDIANVTSILNVGNGIGIDLIQGGVNGVDGAGGAADTINLQGAFGGSMPLVAPFQDATNVFTNPDISLIKDDDIVLVSDCANGEIFQATDTDTDAGSITHDIGGASLNNVAQLFNVYGSSASIYKMRRITYTVTNNELTLSENAAPAQTLVDGVENMQILYGIDTNNNQVPNRYINAAIVGNANWGQVLTVHITLTMRSEDNIASEKDTEYGDRRIRRIFSTTVSIRNRLG